MASSRWYCTRNGQKAGPFSSSQLRQLASAGQLEGHDLIQQEGGLNWVPASNVKGLFPAGSSQPKPAQRRVWPLVAAVSAATLLIGGGAGALLFSGKNENEPTQRAEYKPEEPAPKPVEEVKKPDAPPAPKEEDPKPKPETKPVEPPKPDAAQQKLESFQRYLKVGKVLQDAKQFDAAIKAFTEAVTLMPDSVEAADALKAASQARMDVDAAGVAKRDEDQKAAAFRIFLDAGQANLKLKQFDLAALALREALKIKAADPEAVAALGEADKGAKGAAANVAAQAAVGDRQKKLEEYQKWMNDGRVALYRTREFNAAVRAFNEALRVFPNDPVAAQFLLEAERTKDAAFAAFVFQGQLVEQELTRLAEVKTLLLQGRNSLAIGDLASASRDFDAAARLAPNDPAVIQAGQDLQRALNMARGGDARNKLVNDHQGLLKSGREAIQARRYEDAVNILTTARNLIPDDRTGQELLNEAGRLRDDARRAAENARKKKEEDARADRVRQLLISGRAALGRKHLDAAARAFSQASDLAPNSAAVVNAIRELDQARAEAVADGEQQRLLTAYRQAMKIGNDARMARRFTEAITAFAQAAQLVRGNKETAGLFQEAEKSRQAAQMALNNQNAKNQDEEKRTARVRDLLRNGRAALNAGQFDNADRAFDEAAKIAPNNPEVKQAQQDLGQARKQALNFDLRIEPGQVMMQAGGRARVRIIVDRKGRQGPQAAIDVELRRLPGGVGASRATIPAGQNATEIELGAAPSAKGMHRDVIAVGTVRGINGQVNSNGFAVNIQKK